MALTTETDAAIATAQFFRVLSDPPRVAILERLLIRPHSVSELVEGTGAAQNQVSTHLACPRWCGVAEEQRVGRNVIYSITDPEIARVLEEAASLAERRLDHLLSCERIGPDGA